MKTPPLPLAQTRGGVRRLDFLAFGAIGRVGAFSALTLAACLAGCTTDFKLPDEPMNASQAPDKFKVATEATNRLGLDLFRKLSAHSAGGNVLISPYSLETALAMAYAGAEGDTRAEMARVLGFPADDAPLAASFGAIRSSLDDAAKKSAALAADQFIVDQREFAKYPKELRVQMPAPKKSDTLEWHTANRLFAQTGFAFREPFLAFLKDNYAALLEPTDFQDEAEAGRIAINAWVEEQTVKRIRDLIPPRGVDGDTRLVLVNALYFKSPWENEFREWLTENRTFRVRGGEKEKVPTMENKSDFGYAHQDGFTAVSVPYQHGDLQFLILLPDDAKGVDELAARVTPELQGPALLVWLFWNLRLVAGAPPAGLTHPTRT